MDRVPHAQEGDVDPATVIAGWNERPARERPEIAANALTIDVEDYFQVESFFGIIERKDWDGFDCRVERNVDLILEALDGAGAKATFFTLGWIARRYPLLVRRIVEAGHELASHGSDHRRADGQSRSDFRSDVLNAKALLEDLGGVEVKGYRAPCFSVSRQNLWVMETLADAGYCYSSSTYPIAHDNYGMSEGPRFAFFPLADRDFLEIPVTSMRWLGRNWPCGGGGYFRLLPYPLTEFALNSVSRGESRSLVFYFHPWEIDPGQPRLRGAPFKSRLRHYLNLDKTLPRLQRLLNSFDWSRMDEIFLSAERHAS